MAQKLVLLIGDPQFSARLDFAAAFRRGFVLYWAKSISNAREMLRERQYNLLVVENRGDRAAAQVFCREAKKAHPTLKVVYVSDPDTRPLHDDCVDATISSTVEPEHFLDEIAELLRHRK